MLSRCSFPLATLLTVLTLATTGVADETASAALTTAQADGYGYRFKDDALQAGGLSSTDPQLRIVRHSWRTVLIRPRTQFVPEMLKSVENL
jgi:hypothetical protein